MMSVPKSLVLKIPSYPRHEVFLWTVDGIEAPEEGQHEIGEDEAESSEEAAGWQALFEGSGDAVVLVVTWCAVQAE